MAACATPAPKTDAIPALKPVLADASVCRDQFGRPAPRLEWSAWLPNFERRNGAVLVRHTLTEAERLRFLGTYNNVPPVTDRNPERIEIFSRWNHPNVVVVFVEDGCVTLTALIDRPLVESVISPTGGERRPLRAGEREA